MYPLWFCLSVLCLSGRIAQAQVPSDTVRSFMPFRTGEDALTHAPLTANHDITQALSQIPGSFVYSVNALAWPAGWSFRGLPPTSVQLYFGPVPFDDLLTGRPGYDFLPTALLRMPTLALGIPGGITAIQTELRTVDTSLPHTQLHYQAGDHKLQRVTAMHAQQRYFDRPGRLQSMFAYAGASDAGEYPGSRLYRQRQLLLRTRYQHYSWSLELLYLHNQNRLGAHSGVLGTDEIRYNRLIAQVMGQGQVRRTVRNDVLATFKTRPLTASVYLSSQSLRFRDSERAARRTGISLHRDYSWPQHQTRLLIDAYTQVSPYGSAVPQEHRASMVEALISDSLRLPSGYLLTSVSLRNQNSHWSPRGQIRWDSAVSMWKYYAEISYGTVPNPATEWERYLVKTEHRTGRILQTNTGIGLRMGRLTVSPYSFLSRSRNISDYKEVAIDSVQVFYDTSTAVGGGIDLRFLSAEPDQGLYAVWNTAYIYTGQTRYGLVLPKWASFGQLGFRAVLFTGDLHLNVSVYGRSWSAMNGRTLHAPTGLLVLPSKQRNSIPASYSLDLILEGGIRTATVYVLYENITSGTKLLAGNELVADYPLPARQLRFGVYWPIRN